MSTPVLRDETSPGAQQGPLDLLIALGRYRGMLVTWPLLAAAVALGASFLVPKTYTAVTRTLVPQQNQSTAAAMLNQLSGGLAGFAAGANPLRNPGDLYIEMLKSNSITDALVDRFDLKARYKVELRESARDRLLRNARFTAERSGVMTIEVDDRDPRSAADLANAFVDQLHVLTSTLAVTEASQRRLFFERQLENVKKHLADTEIALRGAMDAGGLVSVDMQSRATIETMEKLRASISAREVQVGAMRAYASRDNPDLLRAESELASMRRELLRLELGPKTPGAPENRSRPTAAGDSGVGNIRLYRELKYNEAMFEIMAKQYEIARLDESKEAPVIQVIDKATPPERKARPRRGAWMAAAFMAGFVAAVLGALVRQVADSSAQDAAGRGKLEALRAAWFRRTPLA